MDPQQFGLCWTRNFKKRGMKNQNGSRNPGQRIETAQQVIPPQALKLWEKIAISLKKDERKQK